MRIKSKRPVQERVIRVRKNLKKLQSRKDFLRNKPIKGILVERENTVLENLIQSIKIKKRSIVIEELKDGSFNIKIFSISKKNEPINQYLYLSRETFGLLADVISEFILKYESGEYDLTEKENEND